MMTLPERLDAEFQERLARFEQELKMPYVTSIERLAIKKGRDEGLTQGLTQGIESVLDLRFGQEGLDLMPEVRSIQGADRLRAVLRAAKTTASPADLRALWTAPHAG